MCIIIWNDPLDFYGVASGDLCHISLQKKKETDVT